MTIILESSALILQITYLLTDDRCLVGISSPQWFEEFIELTLFLPQGQQCWGRGSGKEFCLLFYIPVTKIAFKPPLTYALERNV